MTNIDTNVDNYTITELLSILGLDDPTQQEIMDTTNKYIERYKNDNNKSMYIFFQNIQTKLLSYVNDLYQGEDDEYEPNNKQVNDWYKYQALPQKNTVQKDKITDRYQKIDVYDNQHVPMKKEQLGINNTIDVKVAQDILNPNLENITSRFINLDSQFRQASGGMESSSTDYTLDLSDPLTDVLSLRLYSVQIPYTWYVINNSYGNTCFWITNDGNSFKLSVTPGNYTSANFVTELNNSFLLSGFIPSIPGVVPVSYNSNNGKITINLNGFTDPLGNSIITLNDGDIFDLTINAFFTFFDFSGEKTCYGSDNYACSNQKSAFNNTLGWLMGFRTPVEPILTKGNTPIAVIDLYGPKYFILVIDDFNQNHINNGLITITEISKNMDLPSYYNPSIPVNCTNSLPIKNQLININNLIGQNVNESNVGNIIEDNINFAYGDIPQVLPTAPRTLTQAQIYTINEIMKNRKKTVSYRGKAPTSSDTFALIPIKHSGMNTGDMYVEFSGSLQDSKRIYFGPVDIDRLRIKLLDDKGFLVDLNGSDWCVTIISENLYQY